MFRRIGPALLFIEFEREHGIENIPFLVVSQVPERIKIAAMEFDGEGEESDEALFAAAQKFATKRVDEREFSKKLQAFAADDAALPTGEGPGLAGFMKSAASMPGFDPEKAADYAEEWTQARTAHAERVAPIREQLQHVWRAFRTGVEPGTGEGVGGTGGAAPPPG